MKLSVLMITYNHEPFIAHAIESALMQRVSFAYELVIGEDCSTDRTREIVTAYQQKFPDRIRLLTRERNLGINRNLAQTLQACRGEYIATLEGDDLWTSPDKLQKQVDFLDRNPDFAISFHDASAFNADGQITPRICRADQREVSSLEDLLKGNFIPNCTTVFRRGLFEFPEWLYNFRMGDFPLHIFNSQHGKIGYINEVMSAYRVHSGGVWSSSNYVRDTEELIELYNYIDAHLNFKYEKLIKGIVAENHYNLAIVYEREGELQDAKRHILKCIAKMYFSRNMSVRRMAKILLKAYSPMLFRTAKATAGRLKTIPSATPLVKKKTDTLTYL